MASSSRVLILFWQCHGQFWASAKLNEVVQSISKSIKMVHNGSLKVKAQILNEPPHGEEKLTHSSNLGGTCDTAEIWISSLWRGMWRVMRRINRSYRDSNLQSPFFLCVSHPRGEAAGKQSLSHRLKCELRVCSWAKFAPDDWGHKNELVQFLLDFVPPHQSSNSHEHSDPPGVPRCLRDSSLGSPRQTNCKYIKWSTP